MRDSLSQSRDLLAIMKGKLRGGLPIASEFRRLKSFTETVRETRLLLEERFAARGQTLGELVGMGGYAMERHVEMVLNFREAMDA